MNTGVWFDGGVYGGAYLTDVEGKEECERRRRKIGTRKDLKCKEIFEFYAYNSIGPL